MDKVHEFFIDNVGLHMIIQGDNNPQLINPVDETIIEKYESDFQENGKKLVIEMENTGNSKIA